MSDDFRRVDSGRTGKRYGGVEHVEGEVVEDRKYTPAASGGEALIGAVADNFDKIVDIAASIVEIEKMNAESDMRVRELEEKRNMLAAETDSYIRKLNAETEAGISKAEVIRMMMKDYYIHGKDGLSGEEFSKIVQEVIAGLGLKDE